MKRLLNIGLTLTLVLSSCQASRETIPAFSPPLTLSTQSLLPDEALMIFKIQENIFVLCRNGTLLEASSGKKRLDLKQRIQRAFLASSNRLIIQSDKQTAEILLKPQEASLRPLKLPPNAQLLAANDESLVIAGNNRIHWASNDSMAFLDTGIDADDFLLMLETVKKQTLLVCKRAIFVKSPNQDAFIEKKLKHDVCPPIAHIDQFLWLQDSNLRLHKYRVSDLHPIWEKPLNHALMYPPTQHFDQTLAITRSLTLQSLNRAGSQLWYVSLEGMPLNPPLILDNRVAVLVRSREQVFFKIYDHHGRLLVNHRFDDHAGAPFLINDGELLFTSRRSNKEIVLQRASTHFGISISLPIAPRISQGTLLPIPVKSNNLIQARHELSIADGNSKIIWNAQIPYGEEHSPVWKANHEGQYTLKIITNSLNRDPITSQMTLTVYDRQAVIQRVRERYFEYLRSRLSEKAHAKNPTH